MSSFGFFDEKEKVMKRQPHKRNSKKVNKKETVKVVFEKFLEM
jgi:integrase/recombinase XerD